MGCKAIALQLYLFHLFFMIHSQSMNRIELALPAGSLQTALHAFSSGADAVYFGMQAFSARKGAKNFSFDQLRIIREVAKRNQKSIYITVNTLVLDEELPEVIALLKQLDFIGNDGVIVQDLGIARLIKTQFPSMKLHASTQLAVHTVEGVNILKQLGFSRVVLSRELSLDEIKAIRLACPDVELKVFVHGAECFGFSGLCMASSIITGRSANCGACAQICRTWFLNDQSETGWFTSMSDLKAGPLIRELNEIGIESAKIEGRMKDPSYVVSATKYYKLLLDTPDDKKHIHTAETELSTAFSRATTSGWLSYTCERSPLICKDYPGHRGVIAAQVLTSEPGSIEVILECDLSVHDGVMLLLPGETLPTEELKFSIRTLGSNSKTAKKGSKVRLEIPDNREIPKGTKLYKISSHDRHLPLINEDSLPKYKRPIDLVITLQTEGIVISSQFEIHPITLACSVAVEPAEKPQDSFAVLQEIFSASDTSLFTLGTLTVENKSGYEQVFLPKSQLKAARRDWYTLLDQTAQTWFNLPFDETAVLQVETTSLPIRTLICDPLRPYIPWVDIQKEENPEIFLPFITDTWYIPLAPVMFDETAYLKSLDTLIAKLRSYTPSASIRVGLNNIAQVTWAQQHPEVSVFCDIYLYLANREAAGLMKELLDNLDGGYYWMESPRIPTEGWPFLPAPVGKDFLPPLFISRACYRHDALGLSCTRCAKQATYSLTQGQHSYRVTVDNCLTIITRA